MTPKHFPKVLIGTITFDGKGYVLDRFIERVKELTYPNSDFVMIDNSEGDGYFNKIKSKGVKVIKGNHYEDTRQTISESRNKLVDLMLEGGYDFLFHLEQDVIPRKDIIEELIQWDKEVVGGWYYINQGRVLKRPCIFTGWVPLGGKGSNDYHLALQPHSYDSLAKERLMKIYLGSLGITLIRRDVFEKRKIRFWWNKKFHWHDDTGFYHDCDIKGIGVYIDTDLLCPHFQSSWAVDKNLEKNEEIKKVEM